MGLTCDTPDANEAPRAQYPENNSHKKLPIMLMD